MIFFEQRSLVEYPYRITMRGQKTSWSHDNTKIVEGAKWCFEHLGMPSSQSKFLEIIYNLMKEKEIVIAETVIPAWTFKIINPTTDRYKFYFRNKDDATIFKLTII